MEQATTKAQIVMGPDKVIDVRHRYRVLLVRLTRCSELPFMRYLHYLITISYESHSLSSQKGHRRITRVISH